MAEKENCNHDCSSCSKNCESRDMRAKLHEGSSVKKVIGVISGKGGVGKSFVTCLLACAMNRKGKHIAILDADITGPSIPEAFGLSSTRVEGDDNTMKPVITDGGIQLMSMDFLLEKNTDPVIWRGPVISGAVKQFWTDVIWHDVDYMFVDMPPGTGDVPLTVFQSLPVDGIIVVSSPQQLVRVIVEKAVKMANMMNIPIIGLVENMSYVKCPKCGEIIHVYGKSNIEAIAKIYNLPVLAKIPIEEQSSAAIDLGTIEDLNVDYVDKAVDTILAIK
jgi:Mrp family chromosome partitioning ATPase